VGKTETRPHDADPLSLDKLTARNVASVVRLERAEASARTLMGRIADWITAFWGSITSCGGTGPGSRPGSRGMSRGAAAFDAFPFPLLTLAVSLEAIFLSTFILVSENRQAWVDAHPPRGDRSQGRRQSSTTPRCAF